MQNPVLPQVSSQLYSNGYVDNVSDHPMQMGSRLMNGNDSNYYLDPSLYSTKDELAIDGVFAICSQVPINYHSELHQPSFGAATQLAAKSNIQNSYIDNKNLMHLSQLESITGRINNQYQDIRNTRKRPIENASDFQQRSPEDIVDNKSSETGWPPNKKMSLSFQGQSQDQYNHYNRSDMKEIQRDKVPARKSQKLADRITALQKLVSPYGKTDTASVLQEASLFIKALLDQIENMLVKANPSPGNENSHQVSENKQCQLQDKGLCLVPVSMTQKLVKEDTMYPYSTTMINSPISPEDLSTFM